MPSDAEAPDTDMDALLRSRTAGGPSRPIATPASEGAAPAWYTATPAPRKASRPRKAILAVWLALGATILGTLVMTVWGIRILWLRGPGGEAAYRQHNLAGNSAVERGDYRTGDDEYGQMIALRPRRVDGYLLRGISEFKEGLMQQSIDDNTTALTLSSEPMMRGDLLYNRGQAYVGQGRLVPAIADFTEAHAQYARISVPEYLPYVPDRQEDDLRERADAYWEHKDYAAAIADCDTIIGHYHVRPDDYGIRGKAEAALEREAAATTDLNRALSLDPSYQAAYFMLADMAEKRHHYAQAVAVYQRATAVDPGNVNYWGDLGWFQYEAGQIPVAIATDQKAQSLDAHQAWINCNLALCYAVSGDRARALSAYAAEATRDSEADRKAALTDLRTALTRQPRSALLQEAARMMESGIVPPGVTASAPPAAPRPVSPPPPADPAFAAQLGPEVSLIDGYAIRPPAGYALQQSRQEYLDGSGTIFLWTGPPHADGTVPTLQVVISEDDGRMASHSNSAQQAQAFLEEEGANHSDLTLSPVSACTVNGLPFARGNWAGTGARTGKTFEGLAYVSVAPSRYIEISSHDAVPYSRSTLPLLKAASLTFRKQ